VQVDPVTRDGRVTSPPAFDADCLDETCGSCTLRVNGRVRLGCATRLRDVCEKGRVLHLEPLAKFPLIRDLVVDRSRMRAALEETRAWIEVDARRARKLAVSELASEDELIPLGRCMSCGACLEACPEYGEHSDFVGAAALNRVQLLNSHPNGGFDRALRIESAMAPGGISGCRKAQNCVEVCPVSVPLVDSLQRLSRSTTKRLFAWLFE
jgi:succinate dehydrogenase / fumarate reductase, iron-sulfur subunit